MYSAEARLTSAILLVLKISQILAAEACKCSSSEVFWIYPLVPNNEHSKADIGAIREPGVDSPPIKRLNRTIIGSCEMQCFDDGMRKMTKVKGTIENVVVIGPYRQDCMRAVYSTEYIVNSPDVEMLERRGHHKYEVRTLYHLRILMEKACDGNLRPDPLRWFLIQPKDKVYPEVALIVILILVTLASSISCKFWNERRCPCNRGVAGPSSVVNVNFE